MGRSYRAGWDICRPIPSSKKSRLSAIVGAALLISTRAGGAGRLGFWATARLFITPFCVSSFAALVKGRGFSLVFSPYRLEDYLALGLCAAFCALVAIAKRCRR